MGRRNVTHTGRESAASACAKTAKSIELPFRVASAVGLKNSVLDGRAH